MCIGQHCTAVSTLPILACPDCHGHGVCYLLRFVVTLLCEQAALLTERDSWLTHYFGVWGYFWGIYLVLVKNTTTTTAVLRFLDCVRDYPGKPVPET